MLIITTVKLVGVHGRKCVFYNDSKATLSAFAKLVGVSTDSIRNIFNDDDEAYILERLNDWLLKKHHGIKSKSTTVYNTKGQFTWMSVVTECSGCSSSSAHARLRIWMVNCDCDRLMRPVSSIKGPKKGTIYKPRQGNSPRPVTNDATPGRLAASTIRTGSWEQENL